MWLSSAIKEIAVYKSQSTCIWSNLAFEDWIFKNVDLSFRRILFLWRNDPCVVIGRHQNPWVESNVALVRDKMVNLARRRSGGGAVYHDRGNVNCTVFAHRHDYNRPRNLRLVCHAINEKWGTRLHANQRDDIVLNDKWKVSGSSAKVTKDSTYHHFTLLLDVDMHSLRSLLQPSANLQFSQSTATPSVRSEVANLTSAEPGATYSAVCAAIAEHFYDVHCVTQNRKVVEVDPDDEKTFPGISEMRHELKSWEWVYGKSPQFSITADQSFEFGKMVFSCNVIHGNISNCSIQVDRASTQLQEALEHLEETLNGVRLWYSDVALALKQFESSTDFTLREVCQWILDLL